MWFFKQAQRETVPATQHEVAPQEQREVVPMIQREATPAAARETVSSVQRDTVSAVQRETVQMVQCETVPTMQRDFVEQPMQQQAMPLHQSHSREVVHAVERGMQTVERELEDAEHAGPVSEWFVEVVRPLERKMESVVQGKIENLMDGAGWWEEEKPH